ncbi:MAG: hypothetical protein AABX30_00925 [Nanoarchaeota archaeon]
MDIRKIASKDDEERKKKRNQWIVGIILLVIMVLSTVGYSFSGGERNNNNPGKINYNGFIFQKSGDLWYLDINKNQFTFQYNPKETENIEQDKLKKLNDYSNKPLYIYSENELATQEIYKNIGNFVQRMQPACLDKQSCNEDYPIKDCSNNFIIIKSAENSSSSIKQNGSCVYIQSSEENIIKTSDEFLFNIIGVK